MIELIVSIVGENIKQLCFDLSTEHLAFQESRQTFHQVDLPWTCSVSCHVTCYFDFLDLWGRVRSQDNDQVSWLLRLITQEVYINYIVLTPLVGIFIAV